MKNNVRTKALSLLLCLAMLLSLVPIASLTAYADDTPAYNDYLVTTEANKGKSGSDLEALQVTFNEKLWYIIADNSTAVDAGTVTLLAKDPIGASKFNNSNGDGNAYNGSVVQAYLDDLTAEGGSFAGVANALVATDLTDVDVTGAKLWLLSFDQATKVLPSNNVRKCATTLAQRWWLRTPSKDSTANGQAVNGGNGFIGMNEAVSNNYSVRPALNLDLSKVNFSSETKTFSAHTHSFDYSASDDTITATCNAGDREIACQFKDSNYQVTLTIGVPEHTNVGDGKSAEAVITDENEIQGSAAVSYYSADADGNKTGSALAGAPEDEGKYRAEITLTSTDNNSTATAYVVYDITNLDFTISTPANVPHGAVSADKAQAKYNDRVTLTVTPDEGYLLKSLTVKDAGNNDVNVTDGKFTMPASNVTVTAAFDVPETYTIFYRATGNPSSVKFRMTGSGDGNNMTGSTKLDDIDCWAVQIIGANGRTIFPVAFSADGGSTWGDLTNREVVDDIPNNLAAGSAVIVKGEAKAFIVSFLWGDIEEDGASGTYLSVDGASKNYLVTNNTTSITVPVPAKTGYTFLGWEYFVGQDARLTGTNETVSLSEINKTTIFSARWELSKCKVEFYDGDQLLDALTKNDVIAQSSVSAPDASQNPTKPGYPFDGWVVAEDTTQIINGEESFISAGTPFDFSGTKIVNDLKLKAEWRHVHSYVCLPLDHTVSGGAFNEYIAAGYDKYAHIKLCTGMDDFCVEAHNYVNDKCACGAVKPIPDVTLTETVGEDESTTVQVKQDSVVVVTAPATKGSGKFSKWQYYDGTKWRNLSTSACIAFVIPSDLEVKAVYEAPKAELTVESFNYNGKIAFGMSYKVPDGYTVVDGGLLVGNNSHIRYMNAKQLMGPSGMGDIMFPYIPTTEMPIYYDPATDDATAKFGAAKVAEKMFREEALNVSGKSNPIFKKVSVLGKTGTAAIAIATSADNIYYYGMGYVICKAPNGSYVAFATNAIAATRGNPNHSTTANINIQ